ncbi:MAG TPA: nucleotidyltransferase family protein [Polyangiales bacterium]|nr:nucleotidyltransferase family protein [Polyangiales bacterium]
MSLACTLLAAGGSSRLGRPKQLLRRGGVSLVAHVLQQLRAAEAERYAVVLGCERERVETELATGGCELLDNPEWREGIAASIRVAVAWAERVRADALLLAVCDQPRLAAEHVAALCAMHAAHGGAVASGYAAVRGTPAIVPASWYAALSELRGERGAGALLRRSLEVRVVEWPDGAVDLDSEADAAREGWS